MSAPGGGWTLRRLSSVRPRIVSTAKDVATKQRRVGYGESVASPLLWERAGVRVVYWAWPSMAGNACSTRQDRAPCGQPRTPPGRDGAGSCCTLARHSALGWVEALQALSCSCLDRNSAARWASPWRDGDRRGGAVEWRWAQCAAVCRRRRVAVEASAPGTGTVPAIGTRQRPGSASATLPLCREVYYIGIVWGIVSPPPRSL